MPNANYWPEKPNDTILEEGGRIYTHRDRNGNPARLINSDLGHSSLPSSPDQRLAFGLGKNFAILFKNTKNCKVWAVRKQEHTEYLVTTTQCGRLHPHFAPEFVNGALRQREAPSARWADVKVDTPMWVSTGRDDEIYVSLFSHAEGDTVYTFEAGGSSTDNNGRLALWKYVTVVPTEVNL